MKRHFKSISTKVIDTLADRLSLRVADSKPLADAIAYRVAVEMLLKGRAANSTPCDIFSGISDDFWFWLNTEGCRINQSLRDLLPGMPDEDVQLNFTGNKGDSVMREGFSAYRLFKGAYERYIGDLDRSKSILDFGCGWGRIIRFFLRDIEPANLCGCDPVQEMIDLCQQQNKWCQFTKINTKPPTPFQDNSFDLIYGYSVFSHLSEDMHKVCLLELHRILKPGGLLILTTRSRSFIERCAELRKRADLDALNPGPRSSASAFPNTAEHLSDYDAGRYCFHQLVKEGEWSYWGETAIPKAYILTQWPQCLTFVDYIDDQERSEQNVIIMSKPTDQKRDLLSDAPSHSATTCAA